MKNKHVKSFDELTENKNLNISDVSEGLSSRENELFTKMTNPKIYKG